MGFSSARNLGRDISAGFSPPRRMPISEAVKKFMRVPKGAGNSVPWDPELTPYIIEPMNCLASREYDAVIFVGPARTGKTIGLIDGWIVYIWDGTFKPAYSNNMAWCLWDMLTHPRYGMGKRLGAADVDKWALYVIGQYCDQSVPDGFGGTEPRITCNAWLTTQRKAWDVLSDFCSAMRCMPVWNGQTLTFVQDRPS
ncbi:phage terminase large subunit family protein, partial [Escherichia coli]|nr:phage terminase large subunit family protein [Escherichia coli]